MSYSVGERSLSESDTTEQGSEFNIERLAKQLGMLCKFNGEVSKFQSIAEHRVMVSLLMEEFDLGNPLEGLIADPTLPNNIREHHHLPVEQTNGCRTARGWGDAIQAIKLLPYGSKGFPPECIAKAEDLIKKGWIPLNLYPEEAEQAFMRRYKKLVP